MESSYSFNELDTISNSRSFDDLEKEIEKVQNSFYSENGGKNTFFKKTQKYDCANHLTTRIPIQILMDKMCFALDELDCIYINYSVFKTFANPDNFTDIVNHILSKLEFASKNYSNFSVLLDLDGFTISAAERYKPFIHLFCNTCFQINVGYLVQLNQFIVYNCPSIIDTVKKMLLPLMEGFPTAKVVTILKSDSKPYVDKVAQYITTTK